MELLQNVWGWILIAISGVTIPTILGFIANYFTRKKANKELKEVRKDAKATQKQVVVDAITELKSEVKNVTFTHEIQPIVISEMQKVHEEAIKEMKKEYIDLKKQYRNVVNVLDKLSCYFDDSIGVAEEKKIALREAVENAKEYEVKPIETKIVIEEKKEQEIVIEKPKKEEFKVER